MSKALEAAAEIARLSEETERLRVIIERDRSLAATAAAKIRREVTSYSHLLEGRGSYEFDDDRWRDEFRAAANALTNALKPLSKIASDRTDGLDSTEIVAWARGGLEATRTLSEACVDLHWMARRYADMRSSYAPGMLNRATRALLAMGLKLKEPHFARDGMGRKFDGLTAEQVEEAAQDMPRGFAPDADQRLVDALTHAEALEAENKQLCVSITYEAARADKAVLQLDATRAEFRDLDGIREAMARDYCALVDAIGVDMDAPPAVLDDVRRLGLSLDALNAAREEARALREALDQISLFAGPTLPRYENAVNIIRDMQYVARAALARAKGEAE